MAFGDLLIAAVAVAFSPFSDRCHRPRAVDAARSLRRVSTERTRRAPSPRSWPSGRITVAASVLFYLVAPTRAERPLAAVKQFRSDNNAVIMMVILVLLGAKLLGDGLAGF